MRQLKRTIVILLIGGVVMTVIALMASRNWVVERAVVTSASPERLFTLLETPEGWRLWRSQLDPSYEVTQTAAANTWTWRSSGFGSGTLTFTGNEKPRAIRYARFQSAIGVELQGKMTFEPSATGTTVTWREWAELSPNPNLRLVSTELMDENFDQGLEALKRLAEAPVGTPTPAPP